MATLLLHPCCFIVTSYLLHTNLLVKALHILLNSEISSNDLSTAEIMLTVFYNKLLDICPAEICTMDVHSLIHLGLTKKLWASMVIFIFVFGINGYLEKHAMELEMFFHSWYVI